MSATKQDCTGKLLTPPRKITSAATRRTPNGEEDPVIAHKSDPSLLATYDPDQDPQISPFGVGYKARSCVPWQRSFASKAAPKIRVWAGAGSPRANLRCLGPAEGPRIIRNRFDGHAKRLLGCTDAIRSDDFTARLQYIWLYLGPTM